jgi:hypothetical protein
MKVVNSLGMISSGPLPSISSHHNELYLALIVCPAPDVISPSFLPFWKDQKKEDHRVMDLVYQKGQLKMIFLSGDLLLGITCPHSNAIGPSKPTYCLLL